MNRALFFDRIRQSLFGGKMSASQVSGTEVILDAFEGWPTRWAAYGLATVFHEVGRTMQPVREGFRATDAAARAYVKKHYWTTRNGKPGYGRPAGAHGHVYYGRGYVQLTWLANYAKASDVIGVDLVRNPDRALEPQIAATILRDGMERGWFTGKKLSDYLTSDKTDYRNARRIINGTDKAAVIAGYAHAFEAALRAVGWGDDWSGKKRVEPTVDAPTPSDEPGAPEPQPSQWWEKSPILRSIGQLGAWMTAGGAALLSADWKVIAVLSVVGLALAGLALRYQMGKVV